jgi:hypothetical protein
LAGVLRRVTNGCDARAYPLSSLFILFPGCVGEVAGALRNIVSGLFTAQGSEQNSHTKSDSKSNQEAFHADSSLTMNAKSNHEQTQSLKDAT